MNSNRNIYKDEIDFGALALQSADFLKQYNSAIILLFESLLLTYLKSETEEQTWLQ